jgi:hypothetical protein
MGARVLRGHSGANAVAELIEPLVLSLARPVPGHPSTKKYLAFAARSKAGPSPYTSPAIRPTRAPRSPSNRPLQALRPLRKEEPLESEDEMCVGALCSLAFHAFTEAENSAAAHVPPGARWWDNVDVVRTNADPHADNDTECDLGSPAESEAQPQGARSSGTKSKVFPRKNHKNSPLHAVKMYFEEEENAGRCGGDEESSHEAADLKDSMITTGSR